MTATETNKQSETNTTKSQTPKVSKSSKTAKKPKRKRKAKPRPTLKELIPSYREFRKEAARLEAAFGTATEGLPSSPTGLPEGMTHKQAKAAWELAKDSAESQLDRLKPDGRFKDGARAEQAMLATLQVMKSRMSGHLSSRAAHEFLNWWKRKPKKKTKKTLA